MQKQLLIKLLVLFFLFLGLQLPLALTQSVVEERSAYRDEANQEVAKLQAGEQQVFGPVLVLPYKRSWTDRVTDAQGNLETRVFTAQETLHLLPEHLTVDANMGVETRTRGIFPVPVFSNTIRFKGVFSWGAHFGRTPRAGETLEWLPARVLVGVSGQRGIKQVSPLNWNEQALEFVAGSLQANLLQGQGLHAPLTLDATAGRAAFSFELLLNGTRRFALLPLAAHNQFAMRSNWPHPQFNGGQLPDTRSVSADGFSAQWATTHLATNLGNSWNTCVSGGDCAPLWQQDLGVSLLEPVDVYTLTHRALKYGFLFTAITFAAFFLFELRAGLQLHPIQYGLVGVALGLFFLLLISLAEQIGFGFAYLTAASAGIALISYYLSGVLGSMKRAAGFAALLTALYAALYTLLHQEDTALLIGAVLLFGLLAVVMTLTRNTNWYRWGETDTA